MKYYNAFGVVVILLTFLIAVPVFGKISADEGHSRDTKDIVNQILSEQGVEEVKDLDCDQISDERYEELGDSVMSLMHPDERQHTLMDEMMGGEGSTSLEASHITMGRNYLNCWDTVSTGFPFGGIGGGYGMMGGSHMFGGGWYGNSSILGYQSQGLILFLLGLLIIGLIVGTLVYFGMVKKGNSSAADEILKLRLAKGEIDQKEYDQLRQKV